MFIVGLRFVFVVDAMEPEASLTKQNEARQPMGQQRRVTRRSSFDVGALFMTRKQCMGTGEKQGHSPTKQGWQVNKDAAAHSQTEARYFCLRWSWSC